MAYQNDKDLLKYAVELYDKYDGISEDTDGAAETADGEKLIAEAVEIFKRLAGFGDAVAEYYLGNCYNFGMGVEDDRKHAKLLWESAAFKGNIDAMKSIAEEYEYIDEDYYKAELWYKKAAEAGDTESYRSIGDLYFLAMPKYDYKKAFYWYDKAAKAGDAKSLLYSGKALAYDGEADADAYKQAFDLYNEALKSGVTEAYYNIGYAYYMGQGVKKNLEEGVKWLKKAVEAGDDVAPDILKMAESDIKFNQARQNKSPAPVKNEKKYATPYKRSGLEEIGIFIDDAKDELLLDEYNKRSFGRVDLSKPYNIINLEKKPEQLFILTVVAPLMCLIPIVMIIIIWTVGAPLNVSIFVTIFVGIVGGIIITALIFTNMQARQKLKKRKKQIAAVKTAYLQTGYLSKAKTEEFLHGSAGAYYTVTYTCRYADFSGRINNLCSEYNLRFNYNPRLAVGDFVGVCISDDGVSVALLDGCTAEGGKTIGKDLYSAPGKPFKNTDKNTEKSGAINNNTAAVRDIYNEFHQIADKKLIEQYEKNEFYRLDPSHPVKRPQDSWKKIETPIIFAAPLLMLVFVTVIFWKTLGEIFRNGFPNVDTIVAVCVFFGIPILLIIIIAIRFFPAHSKDKNLLNAAIRDGTVVMGYVTGRDKFVTRSNNKQYVNIKINYRYIDREKIIHAETYSSSSVSASPLSLKEGEQVAVLFNAGKSYLLREYTLRK
ncbi:MAG: sel1 repeat family protein [Clostridiales bacterium]|nr:sel1 repeat family protein [Clostridiales bacterium]